MCSDERQWPCLWFLPLTWRSSNSARSDKERAAKHVQLCANILEVHTSGPAMQRAWKRKIRNGAHTQKNSMLWFLQKWPLLLWFPASPAICGQWEWKYTFPIFFLTGVAWETWWDGIKKKKMSSVHWHTMITFLSPSAFFFPAFIQHVPGQNGRTILCMFCGFSETPNQAFKQMISWCKRSKEQQNSLLLLEQ